MILVQLVDTDSKQLVVMQDTARGAWAELEDKFGRRSVTSVFHALNACISLTMDTSASMASHINAFEQLFSRLTDRCSTASSTDEKSLQGLKLFLSDPVAKAHLLLRTLPASMSNTVEKLQSKADITFRDVRATLLDPSTSSDRNMTNRFTKKPKPGQQQQNGRFL